MIACRSSQLAALALLCLLPTLSHAAGENRWSLAADDWARPRDGSAVARMAPLPEVVQAWEQQPGARLLLRYPGGEEGLMWAHELRAWLVALGIPLDAQELVAASGDTDRVELELTR